MKVVLSIVVAVCTVMGVQADQVTNVKVNAEASAVVQLTDSNFEKLTQASTGATTGPWFVKFYAPWCSHCRQMAPAWERLAKELKGVVNVADLDATRAPNVAKRFAIKGYPTLLLIDKGRMYQYKNGDRSTEKLAAFATNDYKKALSNPVPAPLTFVGVTIDFFVTGTQEAQRIYDVAFRGFFVISTFAFLGGILMGMVIAVIALSKGNSTAHGNKSPRNARKQD
ncbi:Thioredoxin family protein [Babesia bovis T2Bo]|uniref:Thioredoxin family protein n=1 Tax=Babesia bovis TaxID=5865 RepID=A7AUH7_BABBO|nr:Thioredoxin family protein [Babesia bovis T2Bo]EDO06588.1 Thioredoxin family protein [Babesia bovis T2Bo]BAN65262.1 Thioredoxin family protein [Babesia bovis]|eukprot:XP_001610156.1 Thioredoxin family protein [Babesia bovis T2Bo]